MSGDAKPARADYFFYGTLMDAAILARVSGMPVTAARLRPAILDGFRCVRVADRHYPAVVPAVGHRVVGRLFRGAGVEAQRRIAFYEDRDYRPRTVEITGPGGIRARALVFAAGPAMRLTDEDWDFAAWCRRHRRPFLNRLDEWMKGYAARGAVSAQ